ncbi:MAG: hypothetical protein ABEJ31_13035 [Haloarculaceae archaeon]
MVPDLTSPASRTFGPIQIVPTARSKQLVGLVFAFVGLQVLAWAADATAAISVGLFAALGSCSVFLGLFLGGFRFHDPGSGTGG